MGWLSAVCQDQRRHYYKGKELWHLHVKFLIQFEIPENISYEQAATIPIALTTAYTGLYSKKPYGGGLEAPVEPTAVGKYAGSPIVVLGGSSSVGQYGKFFLLKVQVHNSSVFFSHTVRQAFGIFAHHNNVLR